VSQGGAGAPETADGQEAGKDPWELALEGLDLIELDPAKCHLRLGAEQRLFGTVHGREHPWIVPHLPFPLSEPTAWISLVAVRDPDADGRRSDGGASDRVELGVLAGMDGLDAGSRTALETALHLRYFLPRVLRIVDVRDEDPGQSGAVVWTLETDRGPRLLRMANLFEGIYDELGDGRLLLRDGDGTRVEIRDLRALDAASRRLLERYYWL
jgi:hypothetical protein